MKRNKRTLVASALALMLSLSMSTVVMAADNSYSAELNKNTLMASDQDQKVYMTLKAEEAVTLDSLDANIELDAPLKATAVTSDVLNPTPQDYNLDLETPVIAYATADAENVTTAEIITIEITVPANTPAGKYKVGFSGVGMSKDYGTPWVTGEEAYTTLKVFEKAETPTVVFEATGYDTGKLTGVESGLVYKIDNGQEIAITSAEDVELTNVTPGNISVIRKGNEAENTADSDPQVISVERAATPSVKFGNGIIETTAEHEFSENGTEWSACDGAKTNLADGTYYVRAKANGSKLASDSQTIKLVNLTVKTPNDKVAKVLEGAYKINGNVVTVKYNLACRIGFLNENGAYEAINPTLNADGVSYDFTVPEGKAEVMLLIAGDVNGSGSLEAGDKAKLNAKLLGKTELTAEEYLAADVVCNNVLNSGDKAKLNAVLLGKTQIEWTIASK